MIKRKISPTLKSTISFLEKAIKAVIDKNEKEIEFSIWKASSELEYALFLFSLLNPHTESFSFRKTDLTLARKEDELGPTLVVIQDLVREAEGFFEKGQFEKAYEKARIARNQLLRLQGKLGKKKSPKKET